MNGKRVRLARMVLAMGAAISLSACAELTKPLFGTSEPELVTMTSQNLALRSLPAPEKRVRVAVYGFPDLTGQYKERDNVQTLSRAVTQGGSAMLIKALQDAGERHWFTVLDRSGLQDLIRERQIVSEMRRLYRGESNMDPKVLGPLKHAGVILEGGIVGYDTNIQTGGFGARYLGIGADTKWQMDTVTVSLRAVSTESGEVLASVTAQKAIASSALQGNIFRYVALDKLLEMETGITANEPKYVAVQQAIDKAVVGLVIEGSELGIWSFADRKAGRNLIARYRAEKYGNAMPATASRVVPPETRHPARVVEVRPKQRQRTIIRRLKPASTTPAPPPVQTGETLG